MLPYIFYASLVLLGAAYFSQIMRKSVPVARISRIIWYVSLAAVFALLIYYSLGQYQFWKNDEFGKGFLPPHQSISYFIAYVVGRFWSWYLVSAVIALLFLWAIQRLNRRGGERFFHPEESYFIATAVLLVGHPLWLAYIAGILVLYLLFSLSYRLLVRQTNGEPARLSFYYGWIPAALLVLLFNAPLLTTPFFEVLIIAKI